MRTVLVFVCCMCFIDGHRYRSIEQGMVDCENIALGLLIDCIGLSFQTYTLISCFTRKTINAQCTDTRTHIRFYGINIKHICECSNIAKCAMCIVYHGTPQSNEQTQFHLWWHLHFEWAWVSLMVLVNVFNVYMYICRNVLLILPDVLFPLPCRIWNSEVFICKQSNHAIQSSE